MGAFKGVPAPLRVEPADSDEGKCLQTLVINDADAVDAGLRTSQSIAAGVPPAAESKVGAEAPRSSSPRVRGPAETRAGHTLRGVALVDFVTRAQ